VQGVGFRWYVRERARRLGLRGWVKNNSDGSVAVVAAGAESVLARFVEDLAIGPQGAKVSSVDDAHWQADDELPFPFAIHR
jgi:acylphosphatase